MSKSAMNHKDANALLPWYVNGSLSDEEHMLVSQHVDQCSECRNDFEFFDKIDSATNKNSPAVIVPPPSPEKLFAAIDADKPVEKSAFAISRLAVAASIAVAVMTSIFLMGGSDAPDFETVIEDGGPGSGMPLFIQIQFEPGVESTKIDEIMEIIKAENVATTDVPGTYEATVSIDGSTLEDITQFGDYVSAFPGVGSVDIALKPPVRNKP